VQLFSHLALQVLDGLIKAAQKEKGSAEAVVFYKKMQGDYNRYLAEYSTGEGRKLAAERSLMAYQVLLVSSTVVCQI